MHKVLFQCLISLVYTIDVRAGADLIFRWSYDGYIQWMKYVLIMMLKNYSASLNLSD